MRSYKNGKLVRTDHRAANPNSVTRRDRVRDPLDVKTIEQEHDQTGRFGRSIKCDFIDSDGDGLNDMYLRKNRNPATAKPIYRNLGTPAPVVPPAPPPPPEPAPAAGPGSLNATVLAPAAGPGSLNTSVAPPAAGPTGLSAVAPITFNISILDTESNILARVGDPIGTIAYGTDTQDLYVYNTLGFDKWTHYEDN